MRNFATALVLLLSAAFSACTARTDFSVSANLPAQYSGVWITVEQIWLHVDAGAGPDEAGWSQFVLDSPQTFDLATLTQGGLLNLASQLDVPAGSYRQLRLFLADSDGDLTRSAQTQGLEFNNEIHWLDEDGKARASSLRVLNSEKGIGVPVELNLNGEGALGDSSSSTEDTDTEPSSSEAIIDFDIARDVTSFTLGDEVGFFLSPRLSAIDKSSSGTIKGQVDVSEISPNSTSGNFEVQVSAQTLSSDGSRYSVVKSAALGSDGSFTLFPLPASSGDAEEYDLVFHGPTVKSLIIKGVSINEGAPADAASTDLSDVSLVPAETFYSNIAEDQLVTLRGTRVGFYQVAEGDDADAAPYLIEERGIDPITGRFASEHPLSAGDYLIATSAPLFADSALTHRLGEAEDVFAVSEPVVPSGVSAYSIQFTFDLREPIRFDRGQLLISYNGALVTAVSLERILARPIQTPSITLNNLPAAVYYAEVWLWNAQDPFDSLERQPYLSPLDLRQGDLIGTTVTIE